MPSGDNRLYTLISDHHHHHQLSQFFITISVTHMCRTVIISRSAWIVAGSDVLFSGQLIVLQFDKESPRYTYEEPALHMTGNAVADSVSIHPTRPVEFLRMVRQFLSVMHWTLIQISSKNHIPRLCKRD